MSKFLVLTAAIAAAAVLTSASQATPPVHIRTTISFSELSPDYTAACGFPVYVSTDGTVDVTLHTNHDGSVREQDVFPGLRITVSAPSTGESFDHVFGPTSYSYPNGVYVGAPAVITSNGVRGDAPRIPPDAGRVVTPGVVIDIVPGLGPITVPTGPPVSQSGHFEDPETIVAAICTALAG